MLGRISTVFPKVNVRGEQRKTRKIYLQQLKNTWLEIKTEITKAGRKVWPVTCCWPDQEESHRPSCLLRISSKSKYLQLPAHKNTLVGNAGVKMLALENPDPWSRPFRSPSALGLPVCINRVCQVKSNCRSHPSCGDIQGSSAPAD